MSKQYDDFEEGKVIVALNKNLAFSAVPEINTGFILGGIDHSKAEVVFHSKDTDGTGDIILCHLNSKDKSAVIDAVEKLSASPYVAFAEPNYWGKYHVVPNDPLYILLWGMQSSMAPSVWDYTIGSSSVSVGVIDSGIDHNHPDIRPNMWVSPNRQIVNGWNFADNDGNCMDTTGHGTHVAGTIGAVGNNFIGVVGVCWNVSVVSLKFGLDIASAIAAVNFANHYDIPILNASWGGSPYSHALKHAIDQYNGLFVAAAGNEGTNNDVFPDYPASFDSDNIISVAAADQDNTLAYFSNYGAESVDIAAPGTNILSTTLRGEYTLQSGTSMATPHVAGAAALLKSYMPGLSALEIKEIILSGAYRHPNFYGKVLTGGVLDMGAMIETANRLRPGR